MNGKARYMNILWRVLFVLLFMGMTACDFNPSGLQTESGWKAHSIGAWRDLHPDDIVVSANQKWLYISCKTQASLLSPSLMAINLKTDHQRILLFGLHRAAALKLAPDGSLWLGEEAKQGLIWRITEPDTLPDEQRVDRDKFQSSHPAITPIYKAGQFAHKGLTFSKDGRFAYMADEWQEGCVYRYNILQHKLEVLHKDKGWLRIRDPQHARIDAEKLHGQYFNRIRDMQTLPDGKVLLAEYGTGNILVLDDNQPNPHIKTWLSHDLLLHPDSLAWDEKRQWLWISDGDEASYLWAWDGEVLQPIANHQHAKITGIALHNAQVFINLQRSLSRPEILMRLEVNKPIENPPEL